MWLKRKPLTYLRPLWRVMPKAWRYRRWQHGRKWKWHSAKIYVIAYLVCHHKHKFWENSIVLPSLELVGRKLVFLHAWHKAEAVILTQRSLLLCCGIPVMGVLMYSKLAEEFSILAVGMNAGFTDLRVFLKEDLHS